MDAGMMRREINLPWGKLAFGVNSFRRPLHSSRMPAGPKASLLWALQAFVETAETTAAGVNIHCCTDSGRIDYARSLERSSFAGVWRRGAGLDPIALLADGEEAWLYVMSPWLTIERRRPMGSEEPQVVHRFAEDTGPARDERFPVMGVVSLAAAHVVTWLRTSIHKYALPDPRLMLQPDPAVAERVILRDGSAAESTFRKVNLPRWKLRALRQVVRGDRLYTLWINDPQISQGRPSGSPPLFLTIGRVAR